MLGLTLPTLEAPNVTECGRTRCTVEWTSGFPFVKNDEDQTKIGFNITFVPTMMVNHNASLSYEIPAGYMEARHDVVGGVLCIAGGWRAMCIRLGLRPKLPKVHSFCIPPPPACNNIVPRGDDP